MWLGSLVEEFGSRSVKTAHTAIQDHPGLAIQEANGLALR